MGGTEAAASATSALLSALPCHKVEGALALPGVSQAVRHAAALEHMLNHWGTQVRRRVLPLGTLWWEQSVDLASWLCVKTVASSPAARHQTSVALLITAHHILSCRACQAPTCWCSTLRPRLRSCSACASSLFACPDLGCSPISEISATATRADNNPARTLLFLNVLNPISQLQFSCDQTNELLDIVSVSLNFRYYCCFADHQPSVRG
jgi:hypothetical protein